MGPVRLDAVAATALDAARRDWPKTEFGADLESCVVEGSADRLRVAVKNLLDNAAKFGPPEGPIEVRLAGGELTVRDHGPGISPDDLPFVFDRFYRALSSRSAPGSGLGLAVVREIAPATAARWPPRTRRAAAPSCALRCPLADLAVISTTRCRGTSPGRVRRPDTRT